MFGRVRPLHDLGHPQVSSIARPGPEQSSVADKHPTGRPYARGLDRPRFSGHAMWLPFVRGAWTMGSTRRSFTDEYKAEAVSFVIEGGRPVAEVARNIGVRKTGNSPGR